MKLNRHFWIIFGILFTALGIVGIILPILPTTPFVLLAALCFSKGSEKLHEKLLDSKLLGGYARDYKEGKGMLLRRKVFTLAVLWISMGYSIFFIIQNVHGKITMFIIAAGVTIHLLVMKTRKND